MKVFMNILVFTVLIFSVTAHAQELVEINKINKPGQSGIGTTNNIVLSENVVGPCKVTFSGVAPGSSTPVLSREEKDVSGGGIGSYDKLATLFSGKIYSPGVKEPFEFKDITPFEFIQMVVDVHPHSLEHPYNLYLDLEVRIISHSVGDKLSDDAGEYEAVITVTISKL